MKLLAPLLLLTAAVTARCAPKPDPLLDIIAGKSVFPRGTPQSCDLSKAVVPSGGKTDYVVPANPKITSFSLGRGTQNYTCASEDAAPVLQGAFAMLYDATCVGALAPQYLPALSQLLFNVPFSTCKADKYQTLKEGEHYFLLAKSPIFDFRGKGAGWNNFAATENVPGVPKNVHEYGPEGSIPDPAGKAVDWLRLANKGTRDVSWSKAYRVHTVGGKPGTCKGRTGKKATYTVDYSAVYVFVE